MTASPEMQRLTVALADRYRIERELGAGGMATVYLARDIKHERLVALKVLKPELAAVIGGARFLSEIKTTANLQHPHILPLHDSGEVDGTVFYVMPYVEGESLRARLAREKQLPIADALRIATEAAGALDYAHGHGVIHRDIKPENILLHGGHALVADFGIALAVSTTGGTRMTETGMSLGTPTYMSPEQAMGERTLDARTDVYALGCVLYEMLVGDPPYTGSTAQAIVAKVLTEKPHSITAQRDRVPAHVEAAVLAALEKLPADRPATAAAFAAMLADANGSGARARGRAPIQQQVRRTQRAYLLALGLLALVAAWGWLRRTAPESPSLRYELARTGADSLAASTSNLRIALSPDGSQEAFVRDRHLWLRRRDATGATVIAGSDGTDGAVFSPDGARIALITGFGTRSERLNIASLSGAPPTVIADSGLGIEGLSWGDDGYLYLDGLTGNGITGLVRMRPDGSDRTIITLVDTARGESDHVLPDALPEGRGVLFTIRRRTGAAVAVFDLKTKKTKVLLEGANARYIAPGYLLYTSQQKSLVAVPFDVGSLEVRGPAQLVAEVEPSIRDAAEVVTSRRGTVMYVTGGAEAPTGRPVWVDMTGREQPVNSAIPATTTSASLSPDGKRLAISTTLANGEGERLFLEDLPNGALTPLTTPGKVSYDPRWSADGQWVYYLSDPRGMGGIGEVWRIPSSGGGSAERVSAFDDFTRVALTAEWLVAARYRHTISRSEQVVGRRMHGDSTFMNLFTSTASDAAPELSRDGRWLAYVSDGSGRRELFVRPFPQADAGMTAVSSGGVSSAPIWAPDSRTLYYVNADQKLVAVSSQPGAVFQVGARRELFDASRYLGWSLSPDGKRFLAIRISGARTPTRLFLIENLPALLKREAARPTTAR